MIDESGLDTLPDNLWFDTTKLGDAADCWYEAKCRHILNIVPVERATAPSYGIAGHSALAAYYMNGRTLEPAIQAFNALWQDKPDDLDYTQANFKLILEAYHKRPQHVQDGIQVLETERVVAFPVGSYTFVVRLDAIARQNGLLRAFEHKYTARIQSNVTEQKELSAQPIAQIAALQSLPEYASENPEFVLFNMIQQGYNPLKPRYQYVEDASGKRHKVQRTDDNDCFFRFMVQISPEMIASWQATVSWLMDEWQNRLEADYWPRTGEHNGSCTKYNRCAYRRICLNLEREASIIESDYRVEPWKPWALEPKKEETSCQGT